MIPPVADAGSENLAYASLRVAAGGSTLDGNQDGIQDYGSRVGFRRFQELPWLGDRTGAVLHAELGFQRKDFGAHGTRLLFVGVKNPRWGQVSYGKQWSAFYETVGRHMDLGLEQSGFAYEGSERIAESLQVSRLLGDTYLQLDLLRDHEHAGGGFDRLQLGIDHEAAYWHVGAAASINRGAAQSLRTLAASPRRKDQLCDEKGVDCLGASVGWMGEGLTVHVSANTIMAEGRNAVGAALSAEWAPNEFSYYGELSRLRFPGTTRQAIAVGLSRRWTPTVSTFVEVSFGRGSTVERTAVVGLRIDFEKLL